MLTSILTYLMVADISWQLQKMNPQQQKSTSKNWNGRLGEQKKDPCLFGSKLQTATRVDADAKKKLPASTCFCVIVTFTTTPSEYAAWQSAWSSKRFRWYNEKNTMVWWCYDYSAKRPHISLMEGGRGPHNAETASCGFETDLAHLETSNRPMSSWRSLPLVSKSCHQIQGRHWLCWCLWITGKCMKVSTTQFF